MTARIEVIDLADVPLYGLVALIQERAIKPCQFVDELRRRRLIEGEPTPLEHKNKLRAEAQGE